MVHERSARRFVCLALFAAACAPSSAHIRRAKAVHYQAPFATVWNVITAEVHKQYPKVLVEDAGKGRILTDWNLVERRQNEIEDEGSANPNPGDPTARGPIGTTGDSRSGILLRMVIDVKGGPPWKMVVDVEAVEFKPGMAQLVPFKHSDADEPTYVKKRIDGMYVKVYDQLKEYAVEVAEAPTQEKKAPDTTGMGDLPAEAAAAIAGVREAAKKKDTAALEPFMAPEFVWSSGADASAKTALVMWGADPSALVELAKLLTAGCAQTSDQLVSCPATEGGARATFRFDDGQWVFASFLRGR